MFDDEYQNEKTSQRALDKYGPGGLAGGLNKQNLQINNGIFKMPHEFNGFGVTGYKDGGIVKGPGTGTSDSIPAKLPIQSAIIPAHIVKLYGKDYFDKLEAAAPKSGDTKGKVDAKISNGEYQLSPDAVKYWGQDFITKLIGSDNEASESNDSPSEEAAEMQRYAEGGIVDDQNNYSPATAGTGLQGKDIIQNHLIRDDMTPKGQGFYGNINGSSNANAPTVSEYSIGVGVPKDYQHIPGLNPRVAPLQLDGHQKYYDAPSIVPGLNGQQLNDVANGQVSNDVYNAAEKAAADRQWAGKPVFANQLETVTPYPKRSGGLPGYREGGIVGQPPNLRDRALNTADSNAEFRGRNPDFGAKFAQDNAPAPSLSERAQTNATPAQPAQSGLRGRLGMPESTVEPKPPQLGIRERLMTDANSVPTDQVAQSGLRGRLGMADNTPEPVQPQPSLRERVFNPDAPGSTVRPNFGKNLPDSSVQMPKANPWEAEMQSTAGQGLGAKVGSMANKFAGAAGAAGSLAGIAAVASEPSEGDNYLAAKAARGDKQAQQALATGGFNPIADKMKAPINAGLAAAGNAINDNVVQPVVGGVKRLFAGNQEQPAPEAATGSFGVKPNAAPQPVSQPAPAAGQSQPTPTPNAQPAPNPALAPQNQYDSALIPDGNRLQLTPEYNAQLNAKDTRTIAERDASNATPEQIAGVQQRAPALPQGGLGAYQQSTANGGAFPIASKAEQDAYWNNQADAQRLRTLASAGQIRDPYSGAYLGQQNLDNYQAENDLARAGLAEKIRSGNLDREAASNSAAAAAALEREKLNRDQFGAINEKQYDDMGTVKGETARIWNKTTGQFVNADAGALQNKYQQQAIDALNSGDAASQEHAKTYLMQYFPKVYAKIFGKSQG